MTCAENRELHSALLDGELTATERTSVEGHLAGCAECSAELERLARMVGVLHAVPDPRASLGFVDRVLAAARPVPWYTRLGRRLLQPWQVKLPLEAAAVLIVALGAVYVFQKTPELQQATRYEAPAPQPAPAPAVSPPATPAPPVASAPAPPSAPASPAPSAPAPALSARTAETPPVNPAEHEAQKTQQAEGGKREAAMKEQDAARSRDATAPGAPEASLLKDSAPSTAAPAPAAPAREKKAMERRELPAARADAAKQDAARRNVQPGPADQRLGAAAPGAPAREQFVAPDASGRLVVTDRAAAESALTALRERYAVAEAFRRDAGAGAVSLELIVPRGAYTEFSRGLGEIGRWTVDREPASAEPARAGSHVRLQILLTP